MNFFGPIFWLLVTLGVLVTFHEFGHYWVARRCGVKVLRFSVGFGKAIWKRIGRDGTQYQVAMIPLGGYVKMLDAREVEVDPALAKQEFTGKPVGQRIAIVAAGPLFNLIFTLAAFWLMFVIGRPDVAPIVSVAPQSIAAHAGIHTDDRILSVAGAPVVTWGEVLEAIQNGLSSREPLTLQLRGTDGANRTIVLPLNQLPPNEDIGQYLDKQLGLQQVSQSTIVGEVLPGKPAEQAGLQKGDRILSINGHLVTNYADFQRLISVETNNSPTLHLAVQRHETTLTLTVTARQEALEGQPRTWIIGVSSIKPEAATLRYGPLKAITASLHTTWTYTASTFHMIGDMLSGRASAKNLSGVITIAQAANNTAHMGLGWFLWFLALVSLSLAILNLLPIPLLDGGHLLYYFIELVKGSPLSERVMIAGQYIGLVLLFMLMGLAFYNDIYRLFS